MRYITFRPGIGKYGSDHLCAHIDGARHKDEKLRESEPVNALEVIPERETDGGHQGERVEIAKIPVQLGDVDEVQPGRFRLVRHSTSQPENPAF